MLDFDRFEVLTFDCYGTLIDWEAGIWDALRPVFSRHGATLSREGALELFGALEAEWERPPYRDYKTVLRGVLEGMGHRLGFAATEAECQGFARSVADWPAFPDSAPALAAVHGRYRLAIVSNVDDDLFVASARRLGVAFDWVITAEQARSYKPSPDNFLLAIERIGLPRERILHVAQSLYHDVAPARALGLATVWVNRRHGRAGSGATPVARAEPDLTVPDLRALAGAMGLMWDRAPGAACVGNRTRYRWAAQGKRRAKSGGKVDRADPKREMLRHTVATLAYRGGKTLRAAPEAFASFRASSTTRTPLEIVAHIGDLLSWALSIAEGKEAWPPAKGEPWEEAVARFYRALAKLDEFLASGGALACPAEKLFQGPVADALTHVGQLAMLRRMAGAPVRGENYYRANIETGRTGPDQPPAVREFD